MVMKNIKISLVLYIIVILLSVAACIESSDIVFKILCGIVIGMHVNLIIGELEGIVKNKADKNAGHK